MTFAFISPTLTERRYDCNQSTPHIVARRMKMFSGSAVCALLACSQTFAGTPVVTRAPLREFNRSGSSSRRVHNFCSALSIRRDYQVGARGNPVRKVGWGGNQFYVSAIAELIFRGIENHYFV
jgi:hypothetical protein